MAPSLEHFDVYVSFNQKDAAAVRQIAGRLRDEGVSVWLYDWQVTGGAKWAVEMKEALDRSATSVIFVGAAGDRSATSVIFVGAAGLGPQQSQEVLVNIREREQASGGSFRIIPALLPDADETRLPPFLQERQWVDFRKGIEDEQAFRSLLASVRRGASPPGVGEHVETAEVDADSLSDESAQKLIQPRPHTIAALLETSSPGAPPLSKDVREAISLAGMLALSANSPVDSTLLLAAILASAPANPKHAGHSFLSALQEQRPSSKKTTAGPDIIELLGLTKYDLVEIPRANYDLSRRAQVNDGFETLIRRAAALALDTGSTQGTVQVRHVLGAILAPSAPDDSLDASRRLVRLGYDMEKLRGAFLTHIGQYHSETLSAWNSLLPPAPGPVEAKPPDASPQTVPEPPRPEPPGEAAAEESIRQASVSDQPSARDTLGFAPYVKAIATFLTNEKTQPPLTLSIEGEWGSGKSSFMLQLAEALDEVLRADPHRRRRAELRRRLPGLRVARWSRYTPLQDIAWLRRFRVRRVLESVPPPRCLTVEFNPWRHDKESALWASFALEFVRKLSQNMNRRERLLAYLKLLLRRFRWKDGWLIALRMGVLALLVGALAWALIQLLRADAAPLLKAAAGGDEGGEALLGVLKASGFAGYFAAVLFFLSKFREFVGSPFAFDLRKYVESPDYEGNIAFIEQFHEDFKKIVDTYAGGNKVYVFIDDLDRCDVPKAADLMQAINLMITGGATQLVFVIGMDREKVAAGLAVKNEKLLPYLAQSAANRGARAADAPASPAAQSGPDIAFGLEYGYNFIEKFIQIPFRVPQPAQTGVRALLDFIDPLVEGAGEVGSQAQPPAPAVAEPVGKEAPVIKPSEAGANGDAPGPGGVARDAEEPARGTPRAGQNAAEIQRAAGANLVVDDEDEREPEAKEPEEEEGLMLLERGDSLTVRNIVLMVAPALDYNPRRIKQFINLFRLKAYIAYETGLFRRPKPGSTFRELTLEQLGKFVAIGLRWPRLLADLDDDHELLKRLQEVANGDRGVDATVRYWHERVELMNLLKFGKPGAPDPFDPKRLGALYRYSLDGLDVEKLLQVSPRVNRAAAAVPPPAAAKVPPAGQAATEPGAGPVEAAEQDEAAFS